MTRINVNEGRNKKLLVPIIALILCAAALVGAGYAAAMSSATNTGNMTTGDYIDLTLTGKDGATAAAEAISGTDSKIEFNQVNVNEETGYYVNVETLIGSGKLTIDLSKYSGEKVLVKSSTTNNTAYDKLGLIIKIKDDNNEFVELESAGKEMEKPGSKEIVVEFQVWTEFASDTTGIDPNVLAEIDIGSTKAWINNNNTAILSGFEYSVKFEVSSV